jgi:hypothetical protein
MALETMLIILALVYVLAHAVAYAMTEPNRPRHVSEIPVEEPRRRVSRRSRALSRKLIGFGAIVIGVLAVAKGLLMLLAHESIAGMPGWVQTFAGVGRPLTDFLPAFLYLGLGLWIIGAGVATMAERKRRRPTAHPRDAKTPRPGVSAG